MNVIFLDIDGVLNSHRTCEAFDGYGYLRCEDKKLDPVAIGMLKEIQEKFGCKFVISSSWRIGHEVSDFDFLGLDVIGLTGVSKDNSIRGDEIQEYLDAHPEISNYVIIDDDSDMLESQFGHFVKTDIRNGFLNEHFKQVFSIFLFHEN